MSIFGSIMSAIFGNAQASASPVPPGVAPSAPTGSSPPPAAAGQVDVAEVLDDLEDESDEDLDWRHSIVDLMKLLKLDSSLTARKTLATELGYTGNMGDSASMNIWLHKQVMTKLAENGGKVPADLH
ncbi:MAG: DUF3597 domain-containing protein [Hyphomicrobiaceae bacterium]|jgi:hypothetical protein